MEDITDLAARLDARLKQTAAERVDNDGWHTASEYAQAWGVTHKQASDRLGRAVRLGLMRCERRPLVRNDGVVQRYPMYCEVPAD